MFGGLPLSRYFVVFVDDYSRYSWIFHKHRSKLLQIDSNFAKIVETQFSKHIKKFQSDNALECTQYDFQVVLHSYGIIHQLTCLGTSQQNGKAKRKLRQILDTFRALFSLPKFLFLFRAKLLFMLFMLLIAFQVLLSKIKLHMSVFLVTSRLSPLSLLRICLFRSSSAT